MREPLASTPKVGDKVWEISSSSRLEEAKRRSHKIAKGIGGEV